MQGAGEGGGDRVAGAAEANQTVSTTNHPRVLGEGTSPPTTTTTTTTQAGTARAKGATPGRRASAILQQAVTTALAQQKVAPATMATAATTSQPQPLSQQEERRSSNSSTSSTGQGERRSTLDTSAVNPLLNTSQRMQQQQQRPTPATPSSPVRSPQHRRDDRDKRQSVSESNASSNAYTDDSYSSISLKKKPVFAAAEGTWWNWINELYYKIKVPTWWRKLPPRYRQVVFCLISEVIMFVALFIQFYSFQNSLHTLFLDQAGEQVRILDMTYARKLDEVALLAKGWSQTNEVIGFMNGQSGVRGCNCTEKVIDGIISYDSTYLNVEFAMLLNTDADILYDVNINRTGKHYDPFGIVTRVLHNPYRGQLQVAHNIKWAELMEAEAPIYRQSYSDLLDQDLTHPFDTHEPALMRFTVTPVFANNNGTGKVLGAVLTGDITNGKTPITYVAANSLRSGYAGVYTLDSKDRFIRSSSTIYLPTFVTHLTKDITTSTFEAVSTSLEERLLRRALEHPDEVVKIIDGDFAYAAKIADAGKWNTTVLPQELPQAVLVRAFNVRADTTFTDLLHHTWYFFVALLVINVMSVVISTKSFIYPLEDLAAALKEKRKVDLSKVGSLGLFAKYLLRLCVTLVTALVCSSMIAVEIEKSMRGVVEDLVLSEIGIADVGYNILIDQMSQGIRSMANLPRVREFVHNPNDTMLFNETHQIMKRERDNRKLEFFALTNRDNLIINAANMKSLGHYQDPGGACTLTATYNLRYKVTSTMDYGTFIGIHPPLFEKHVLPHVPDSGLSPYVTKNTVVIRWVTTPVYSITNTQKLVPDAVISAGDIINGKPALAERVLRVMGTGYVGYFVAKGSGKYELLVSVLIDLGTKVATVDVDIAHDVIRLSAQSGGQPQHLWGKVKGKEFALVAERVPHNRYVSKYGQINMQDEAVAYVVYGRDKDATKKLQDQQNLWVIFGVILQLCMMLFMNYTAYQPFHKLMLVLEDKGFTKKQNRPTVARVIRVYIIDATAALITDLRSRPVSDSFKLYVQGPLKRQFRRLRKFVKHIGHRRRSRVKPVIEGSVSVTRKSVSGEGRSSVSETTPRTSITPTAAGGGIGQARYALSVPDAPPTA